MIAFMAGVFIGIAIGLGCAYCSLKFFFFADIRDEFKSRPEELD